VNPENEAIYQSVEITFDWEDAANATEYIIEYADNSEFSSSIQNTSAVSEYPVSGLTLDQTYYWRVYASDGTNISEWSEVWSFTTGTEPLNIPVLISPENGAVEQLTELTLEWNTVTNATNYEYQYSTDNTFSTYENGTTSNTETDISGLEYETEYFWRVQATDGSQYSEWSEVWSFTTENNVGISDIQNTELITVFPNPTTGIFTIKNLKASERPLSVEITNINGQIIYSSKLQNIKTSQIDISNQPKGIYFIKIRTDKTIYTVKIILK
ncbi:MAG: T9SS type A sorting domain-containing protein, partial [Bacteroidota bacterium]|nr:T9SS type A sorting domain-containing protein [Bacteroidota bacterium]